MNSFMARCPSCINPQHTALLKDPPQRLLVGQTVPDLPRRAKGRRVLPLTSLEVSAVSCSSSHLATLRCACVSTVAAGQGSLGDAVSGKQREGISVQSARRATLSANSSSAAVPGSVLGRSVTSKEVSKRNKTNSSKPSWTPKLL